MLTTPWISRLAALLLLAVVAAAAYQLVVGPVVNAYADTRQAVADVVLSGVRKELSGRGLYKSHAAEPMRSALGSSPRR